MENLRDSMKETSKYWWMSLLVGILAIIIGVWCFCTPDTTLVALTIVFIVTFFISGIFDITLAVSSRNVSNSWGWILAGGIIDLLFGILLMVFPLPIITTILVYFIGFWIMFRSILAIGSAFDLRKDTDSSWLLVTAILGLFFSFFYFLSPVIFKGILVVVFVSIAIIVYGIFRVYFAFKLRSINKKLRDQ